ncbi:hypothetical protein V3C99_013944 [Haemonchus contortus]|uniref:Uncharacterized protein n=1 Tax=Haemonchus contortus TaxID=6289 RepID=A0A7I4YR14_HAECO
MSHCTMAKKLNQTTGTEEQLRDFDRSMAYSLSKRQVGYLKEAVRKTRFSTPSKPTEKEKLEEPLKTGVISSVLGWALTSDFRLG